MKQAEETAQAWIVEQRWELTYRHAADAAAAAFFRTLRDGGRLHGTRCPVCGRVLVPPRHFCDRDFVETEGWVELGDEGTIELFTIVYHRIHGLPDPPYALAYVRPDGADTALVNFARGVDLEDPEAAQQKLAIGKRAKIRYADQRQGLMTDFWFDVSGG